MPINTTAQHSAARFVDIPRANIDQKFTEGFKVAVVAGFQGIGPDGRITTLGRGGSDTTAVAFAAAFGAERCDIYTDVDGVYTTDPRITSKARKLDRIAFEEMLELASLGAKVLQTRSVELAMRYKVRLRVLSSLEDTDETSGTLVCDEDEIDGIESRSPQRRRLFPRRSQDHAGHRRGSSRHFRLDLRALLADAGVNVDMIVQNISERDYEDHPGAVTDMTFSCPVKQSPAPRRRWRMPRLPARSPMTIWWSIPRSPRCPSSASGCAAMRVSRRACSRHLLMKTSTSR